MGMYDIGDDPFNIGDEEMGDDDVGAVVKRALASRGAKATPNAIKALAGRLSRKQALEATEPGGSNPIRVQKSTIDSVTTIAVGVTQTVTTRPQKKFRADRFTITPNEAAWLVNSIQIGVEPQFVNSAGATGGAEFGPNATAGANMQGSTANPGIDISVSVTNAYGAGALRFTGSFTGPALE